MNYDTMRRDMLKGFNTYDTYSVLSHVLLPEGFAIRLGLKNRVDKSILRNALIGRFGDQEEHIHPGVRTVDGSYTQLELEYRGAKLRIRSAAQDRDQYILIEPENERCRELILFMECGFLWKPARRGIPTWRLYRRRDGRRLHTCLYDRVRYAGTTSRRFWRDACQRFE